MKKSPDFEPSTIGLSEEGRQTLLKLDEAKIFPRMLDAYRFAIALGLAHGGFDDGDTQRRTIFNVGSLDPDGSLRTAVEMLRADLDEPVYRSMERYAEWGAAEMNKAFAGGGIAFSVWLDEALEQGET